MPKYTEMVTVKNSWLSKFAVFKWQCTIMHACHWPTGPLAGHPSKRRTDILYESRLLSPLPCLIPREAPPPMVPTIWHKTRIFTALPFPCIIAVRSEVTLERTLLQVQSSARYRGPAQNRNMPSPHEVQVEHQKNLIHPCKILACKGCFQILCFRLEKANVPKFP